MSHFNMSKIYRATKIAEKYCEEIGEYFNYILMMDEEYKKHIYYS